MRINMIPIEGFWQGSTPHVLLIACPLRTPIKNRENWSHIAIVYGNDGEADDKDENNDDNYVSNSYDSDHDELISIKLLMNIMTMAIVTVTRFEAARSATE